jgi:hypothetical protein
MLLIDGVKYELWTPPSEDEFERVVKEHTQEIFGEQSIYLDRKQKLKSLSGIGSIPDGYAIILGDVPHWHIVEVELSSHPLHDHIVAQVGRFISGINNPSIQKGIVNAIDEEIARDDFLKLKLRKAIQPTEIYKFLSDLISKQPILTIIIEKETEELREALNALRYSQIKVAEFQTFVRERTEGLAVHAHLFESLYQGSREIITRVQPREEISTTRNVEGRVTLNNLVYANILKVGQSLYGVHQGKKYEGKILAEGRILLIHNGETFDSPSGAASKVRGYQEDGWRWWHTYKEDGSECELSKLRKDYLGNLSP